MPGNENVRVAGPVLEMLGDLDKYSTRVPFNGFMAHMKKPQDGFSRFKLDRDTYVLWVGSPDQFPGAIGLQMAKYWDDSLGAAFVINPRADSYGIIFMESAVKNTWSPLLQPGESSVWHGLGGIMAFEQVIPHGSDRLAVLEELGLVNLADSSASIGLNEVTPLGWGALNLMGAASKVVDKARAMRTKCVLIQRALNQMGTQIPVGLGGMKSIVLHAPDHAAKVQAVRMMAIASAVLGIYISGGDEGTSRGDWTSIFAKVAPNNMAGASTSNPLLIGRVPNEYTADGVFEGIEVAISDLFQSSLPPMLIQGVGGVGTRILERSLQRGLPIAGLSDTSVAGLQAAMKKTRESGIQTVGIWNRKGAREFFNPEKLIAEEKRAKETQILIADGLAETIQRAATQGPHREIGILSPNATSHQITAEVVETGHRYGVRYIGGAANNMRALNQQGSYAPVARREIKLDVMDPHDSGNNRNGAYIILEKVLRQSDADVRRMQIITGKDVRDELSNAHRKGISPQDYTERSAQQTHNHAVRAGMAIGGYNPSVEDGMGSGFSSLTPFSTGSDSSGIIHEIKDPMVANPTDEDDPFGLDLVYDKQTPIVPTKLSSAIWAYIKEHGLNTAAPPPPTPEEIRKGYETLAEMYFSQPRATPFMVMDTGDDEKTQDVQDLSASDAGNSEPKITSSGPGLLSMGGAILAGGVAAGLPLLGALVGA